MKKRYLLYQQKAEPITLIAPPAVPDLSWLPQQAGPPRRAAALIAVAATTFIPVVIQAAPPDLSWVTNQPEKAVQVRGGPYITRGGSQPFGRPELDWFPEQQRVVWKKQWLHIIHTESHPFIVIQAAAPDLSWLSVPPGVPAKLPWRRLADEGSQPLQLIEPPPPPPDLSWLTGPPDTVPGVATAFVTRGGNQPLPRPELDWLPEQQRVYRPRPWLFIVLTESHPPPPVPAFACATFGSPFLFTRANWDAGVEFFFEVYFRASAGTVKAQLWNLTDGALVSGSELVTSSGTFVRMRSGVLSLADGKLYVAQFCVQAGATGQFRMAKVIGI